MEATWSPDIVEEADAILEELEELDKTIAEGNMAQANDMWPRVKPQLFGIVV